MPATRRAAPTRPEVVLDRSTGRKLHFQIADHIRDGILTGQLAPGQKLVVDDVAKSLGVSSMPVREAMVALANEGMLTVLARRGFAVGHLRRTDIEDVVAVHAFVAGIFAERSAALIDSKSLRHVAQIQRDLEATAREGNDTAHLARVGDLNFEFHRTINGAVPARRLAWFLRAVTRYVPRHVYEAVSGWAEISVNDHPGILRALKKGDGALARELTEAHVRHTGESLINHLEAQGFWKAAP